MKKALNNPPKGNIENRAFRYLYAFAILFVVLSHCDGGGFEMLSNWIHFGSFHLAVFVFGSGYFFKPEKAQNVWKYIGKKIYKLLLPLWVFNGIYGIVLLLMQKNGFSFDCEISIKAFFINPISSKNLFVLNMGCWFLFPFFCVQIIYILGKKILDLCKKEAITDLIWQMLLLCAGVFAVYLSGQGYQGEHMQILFRIAYFMPFYILGMLYKKYMEKYLDNVPATFIFAACLIIALGLNAKFGRVVYAIPSSCDYPFGVFATYLSAVIGILFWLTVSKKLAEFPTQIKVLNLLGNHTFDIMIHQFAGIMLAKYVFVVSNRLLNIFADFDYSAFYSDVWYLYLPKGLAEFKVVYVVFAIAFSIAVGYCIRKLKEVFVKSDLIV